MTPRVAALVSDKHPDSYELRLFLGFDNHRITENNGEAEKGRKKEGTSAALHFYSRRSGRLIKTEPDARHILGLSTGGSMFCSALTVIVDDVGGRLVRSRAEHRVELETLVFAISPSTMPSAPPPNQAGSCIRP